MPLLLEIEYEPIICPIVVELFIVTLLPDLDIPKSTAFSNFIFMLFIFIYQVLVSSYCLILGSDNTSVLPLLFLTRIEPSLPTDISAPELSIAWTISVK